MWENVQIFVYRVSDSHKCLLQKVTPTIKSLFAIESNAACKICLCFRSYIQFRKLKMTAGTQCRSFFLFLFIFATWVVNTHHESESLPSPCFHTKFFFYLCFSGVGVIDLVGAWPKSQCQQQQLVRGWECQKKSPGLDKNSPSQPSWAGKRNPDMVVVQGQLLVSAAQVRKGGGALN